MDRAQILEGLRHYFVGKSGIVAAWLFGSVARGDAKAHSDVDVGVLLTRQPRTLQELEPIATIQADLETLLRREVDVVPMNGAAPDLLHRILRDGTLIHETDHRRRIEFEVQARNEYWDLLPILEHYRRTLIRRA